MSGVLRRGSLTFDCNLNSKRARGSYDANLYGGYRDAKPRTPEISVIAIDFRRYSEDLQKKEQAPSAIGGGGVVGGTSVVVNDLHSAKGKTSNHNNGDDEDTDEISTHIGHYGRWQFVWTLLLCLFQLPPTFHMFTFVFQTAEKAYWCAPPADLSAADALLWRNYSQNQRDACQVPLISTISSSISDDGNGKCSSFEFDHSGESDAVTLTEEFQLVCERRELLSVVEMCFLAGAAIGSVSSGWISDRFGRKHTLMSFALVQTVFGTALAFVNSLATFMALRLVLGFASMTVTVVSFVLVVELVSGRWRIIIGILNILPVALTYVLTAGIAYYVRDWRMLQLAISLPELLLLLIWYCMPESPRWLLARGRLPQLCALVERAARMNGRQLQPNYKKSLEAAATATATVPTNNASPAASAAPPSNAANTLAPAMPATPTPPATPTTPLSTTDQHAILLPPSACDGAAALSDSPLVVVFSGVYWRTTVLMLVIWFTLIIIYFGLTLHLSNLGGNIYLNTSIAGSVEAVSICLSVFVVLRLGLRRNLIVYMLISGVCCLLTNLMPHDGEDGSHQISVIALAMIAKCVIGASNAIIPIYTAMQYPTIVRNFGVGMGNLAAGLALILVPYMWLLETIEPLLPMSVMGVAGLVGAVALLLMKDANH